MVPAYAEKYTGPEAERVCYSAVPIVEISLYAVAASLLFSFLCRVNVDDDNNK